MPFILIRHSGPPLPADQAQALVRAARDLVARSLGKRPEVTSVLLQPVGEGMWLVGDDLPARAAQLEVTVTAGTNDATQKARFVAEGMDLLRAAFGGVSPATYVLVHDLEAGGWGYDGRTQAARRASPSGEVAERAGAPI